MKFIKIINDIYSRKEISPEPKRSAWFRVKLSEDQNISRNPEGDTGVFQGGM
ncbi:MAG: hypothetical protein NT030_06095 [Candidatus Saganbacteria bacterium]|nr:hypothetical protein [Candidatus Saganbacteria bacterium]